MKYLKQTFLVTAVSISSIMAMSLFQGSNANIGNLKTNETDSSDMVVDHTAFSKANAAFTAKDSNGVEHLYIWGSNEFGQLGNGTVSKEDKILVPTEVNADAGDPGLQGTVEGLALTDGSVSIAIQDKDGISEVYSWGENNFGQVGNGTTETQTTPQKLVFSGGTPSPFPGKGKVIFLEGGNNTVGMIVENNDGIQTQYMWGDNSSKQIDSNNIGPQKTAKIPSNNPWVDLGADAKVLDYNISDIFSEMLLEKDGIQYTYSWGTNLYGNIYKNSSTIGKDEDNIDEGVKGIQGNIDYIKTGSSFSTAIIDKDGVKTYYGWGLNDLGQIGNGNNVNVGKPMDKDHYVREIDEGDVISFDSRGSNTSIIIKDKNDGKNYLYSWGDNSHHQISASDDGSFNTPQKVMLNGWGDGIEGDNLEIHLGTGGSQYLTCTKNGIYHMYSWGNNDSGQLGNGTTISSSDVNDILVGKAEVKDLSEPIITDNEAKFGLNVNLNSYNGQDYHMSDSNVKIVATDANDPSRTYDVSTDDGVLDGNEFIVVSGFDYNKTTDINLTWTSDNSKEETKINENPISLSIGKGKDNAKVDNLSSPEIEGNTANFTFDANLNPTSDDYLSDSNVHVIAKSSDGSKTFNVTDDGEISSTSEKIIVSGFDWDTTTQVNLFYTSTNNPELTQMNKEPINIVIPKGADKVEVSNLVSKSVSGNMANYSIDINTNPSGDAYGPDENVKLIADDHNDPSKTYNVTTDGDLSSKGELISLSGFDYDKETLVDLYSISENTSLTLINKEPLRITIPKENDKAVVNELSEPTIIGNTAKFSLNVNPNPDTTKNPDSNIQLIAKDSKLLNPKEYDVETDEDLNGIEDITISGFDWNSTSKINLYFTSKNNGEDKIKINDSPITISIPKGKDIVTFDDISAPVIEDKKAIINLNVNLNSRGDNFDKDSDVRMIAKDHDNPNKEYQVETDGLLDGKEKITISGFDYNDSKKIDLYYISKNNPTWNKISASSIDINIGKGDDQAIVSNLSDPKIVGDKAEFNVDVNLNPNPDISKSDSDLNIVAKDNDDPKKTYSVTTDGELNGNETITVSGFSYDTSSNINLFYFSKNKNLTQINKEPISINISKGKDISDIKITSEPVISDKQATLNINVNLNPNFGVNTSDSNVKLVAKDSRKPDKQYFVKTDGKLDGDEVIEISGFNYNTQNHINLFFTSDNQETEKQINDKEITINIDKGEDKAIVNNLSSPTIVDNEVKFSVDVDLNPESASMNPDSSVTIIARDADDNSVTYGVTTDGELNGAGEQITIIGLEYNTTTNINLFFTSKNVKEEKQINTDPINIDITKAGDDKAQVSDLTSPEIIDNTVKFKLNVNLNPDTTKVSDSQVVITAEDASNPLKTYLVTTDGELNGEEEIVISGFDYDSLTNINLYFTSTNNKNKLPINKTPISINIPKQEKDSSIGTFGIAMASTTATLTTALIVLIIIYILKNKKNKNEIKRIKQESASQIINKHIEEEFDHINKL